MDRPFTVSELTGLVKELLTGAFPRIAVRGQVSNLRRQSSGHLYFSLKDEGAQLVSAMWRSAARGLRFRPADGDEVIASGRIDVYPPHGKYQMIVDRLEPVGVGELHRRLEELKRSLAAEGLFASERKQSLPLAPRRVAVVTSPTGAALRDFLRIARRRAPGAWITVFPVRVQGETCAAEVTQALADLSAVGEFDVVVVTRGGGSIEDLFGFHDEAVARAIAVCPVPVVSAVGHETDVTIADLVADVRAATPSEAAELVFPDWAELRGALADARLRLDRAQSERLDRARERLVALARSHALGRPLDRLQRVAQDLDEWERRAADALSRTTDAARVGLRHAALRLEAVSPLAVLGRGYSITRRADDPAPLRSVAGLAAGTRLSTRIADGIVLSDVVSADPVPDTPLTGN